MLEQNMRDLEDAWPRGGGGGTAQSIISVIEATYSATAHGGGEDTHRIDIDIPSDPSFAYYVEWNISGNASCPQDIAITYYCSAGIETQSEGAGFEHWGFATTLASGETVGPISSNQHWATGHGYRINKITNLALLGNTATLVVNWHVSTSDGSTDVTHSEYCSAKLIAIPVA